MATALKEVQAMTPATVTMSKLIRERFDEHGYKINFIIDDLLATESVAVRSWVEENITKFLHHRILAEMQQVRSQLRQRVLQDKKAAANRFHETGDISHLTIFDTPYDVGDPNEKVKLGDLNKEQVLFIANHRGILRDRAEREEKLMLHIAKQLEPGQTVKDVFTIEQIEGLYRLYGATF